MIGTAKSHRIEDDIVLKGEENILKSAAGLSLNKKRKHQSLKENFKQNWQLYVFVLPAIIYFFVFNYLPLYGIQIAFKDFKILRGIAGSRWVGLANYASILNPEGIILTGGIPHAGRWLLEPAVESFEAHVFRNIQGKTTLLVSILKDGERDVLGASVVAWMVKEYSLFL